MNDVFKTGLELTFIFIAILLGQYIRFKFPHFSMHFFDGVSRFGVNSFDFVSKCKEHSKQDIEDFSKTQKIVLIALAVLFSSIMIFYIVSHL